MRIRSCLFVPMHMRCVKEKCLTTWLHWMRNCFKYGSIGEQWKHIESERWFNPDFENFLNKEIMPKLG
jgi:hypothetical protein